MVAIKSVERHSRAERAGICAGDVLLSIDGHEINDVLDYGFYLTEKKIEVSVMRGGEKLSFTIKKDTYDDIGLCFETSLMDKKHHCENGCIFCFIDQNPKGMRPTIYFKDDDSRLSFIHGNYITLTNLQKHDIDRMIEMHISPINISVHTTDPELRVRMMKNKRAGDVLSYMEMLVRGGCELHCQIVLCRGINDGAALCRTMTDLSLLYPGVTSVSVVPAGLTGHREMLYPLSPFTPEECADIIKVVDEYGSMCLEKYGARIFRAADELFIKAGLPLPDAEYYGDYDQLDNGVGLVTSFIDEIDEELKFIDTYDFDPEKARHVSIATGEAASDVISAAVEKIRAVCYNLDCRVYTVKNNFFGGEVTVAGLLTGVDMAEQLRGKALGDELLIPPNTLRAEGDLFLCGHTPEWLSDELGVPVRAAGRTASEFISAVLGCADPGAGDDSQGAVYVNDIEEKD